MQLSVNSIKALKEDKTPGMENIVIFSKIWDIFRYF